VINTFMEGIKLNDWGKAAEAVAQALGYDPSHNEAALKVICRNQEQRAERIYVLQLLVVARKVVIKTEPEKDRKRPAPRSTPSQRPRKKAPAPRKGSILHAIMSGPNDKPPENPVPRTTPGGTPQGGPPIGSE
jgi:hypothetical protein